jgi:hypothetical protein
MARKRDRHLVDVKAPFCTRSRDRHVFHYEQLAIPADRTSPVRSLFSLVLAPRLQARCLTNVAADELFRWRVRRDGCSVLAAEL